MISGINGGSSRFDAIDSNFAGNSHQQLVKRLEQNRALEVSEDAARTEPAKGGELKEAFEDFVGQTFFSEMMKSLRSTQQDAAYMNGGRAEKIFQGQLDQMLTDELSDATAEQVAEPMYELFMNGRQR